MPTVTHREIERVFHEEYGRAVAVLVRVFGDIDTAEEAVQDAFAAAVQRWPASGLPPSPAGWIITTARNRASIACAVSPRAMTARPRRHCCMLVRSPWGRAPYRTTVCV